MADEVHILIGNGFNIALTSVCQDVEINFSYEAILKEVKKRIGNQGKWDKLLEFLNQAKLEKKDKIEDVERLLWILNRSLICLKYTSGVYTNPINGFEDIIVEHAKILKKQVIDVMTDKDFHPVWKELFDSENNAKHIQMCGKNLKAFKRIFTTNYDLILYWLLCDQNLIKDPFKDGFIKKLKDNKNLLGFNSNWNRHNLFFLHGALHILSKGQNAYKVIRGDSKYTLDEIKKDLLGKFSDYDNCLVFNAASREKLQDIYRNDCLIKAYEKLLTIKKLLIVYGCKSPKDGDCVDLHLWTQIINSNVRQIYVGVEDENLGKQTSEIVGFFKRYKTVEHEIKVSCFPYKNCNIWEVDNFFEVVIKNSYESEIV